MSDGTKVEWCHLPGYKPATCNPVRGCTRVNEGCRNCYAERQAIRQAGPGGAYEGLVRSTTDGPRWTGQVRLVPEKLTDPIRWRKPRVIFADSMSDLFHDQVPESYIWATLAVTAACPQHIVIVATKRVERAAQILGRPDAEARLEAACDQLAGEMGWCHVGEWTWPLKNFWLLYSASDQESLDAGMPHLFRCPVSVRGVSLEPLLRAVSLDRWFGLQPGHDWAECLCAEIHPSDRPCIVCEGRRELGQGSGLHWVILGGESGPRARPMHPQWARGLRDQCVSAGVPFFFKQWGEWKPISEMDEQETNSQYHPAPEDDPNATRQCKVPTRAVQYDGEDGYWLIDGHVGYKVFNVGKKAAGALLDGREHREFPQVGVRA